MQEVLKGLLRADPGQRITASKLATLCRTRQEAPLPATELPAWQFNLSYEVSDTSAPCSRPNSGPKHAAQLGALHRQGSMRPSCCCWAECLGLCTGGCTSCQFAEQQVAVSWRRRAGASSVHAQPLGTAWASASQRREQTCCPAIPDLAAWWATLHIAAEACCECKLRLPLSSLTSVRRARVLWYVWIDGVHAK